MGVLMRVYVVYPLPIIHKYMLHAHSHVAILGWIYLGLTTLVYHVFLKEANRSKKYKWIFRFTNLTIFGMLVFFPFQGYALFSIIFSTLFLFASYWFAAFALRNVPDRFKHRFSWKLIKYGIWYLVISSIGPWAIGGVMATLGPESIWYKTSIYFYLHFQYNGWFILALFGVLFYILEEKGFQFDQPQLKSFFFLLNWGVILSFFLSILWVKPPLTYFILGFIGGVIQLLAFTELYQILKPRHQVIQSLFSKKTHVLIKIAVFLTGLKLAMQIISAHPYFAELAYVLKDFIIGYLHMVFLGIIIPIMLVFLYYFNLIKFSKSFIILFLITMILTEIVIYYKAIALWIGLPFFENYYVFLAVISCLFLVAIGLICVENLSKMPVGLKKRDNLS